MRKSLQLILMLLAPVFCFAKLYTVNSSSQLNKLMKDLVAGDTVIWQNGTYENESILFYPNKIGTAKNPIVLKAETPGSVIFKGNSHANIYGIHLKFEGFTFKGDCTLSDKINPITIGLEKQTDGQLPMYCSVTNCAIIDYTLTEASQKNNNYVEIKGTHNELDHCYFKGKINKGPTVTIRYFEGDDYIKGSDNAPSTYHHIHHNYFGYRTYSENGGEQIRVGVSTTSNTKGFNIIESNYFEDTRIEAEVISNKSCYNIYRFNTFYNNDGALVLRHGTHCLVYGNYINGKSGRGKSGGIRIVNDQQTVFNNYIEIVEGGETSAMKGPLVLMSGIAGADVNEYNPADKAIVTHNIVVNSLGVPLKLSIGNSNKSASFVAPRDVLISENIFIQSPGISTDDAVFLNADPSATYQCDQNITNYSNINEAGFKSIASDSLTQKNNLYVNPIEISLSTFNKITARLKVFGLELSKKEMTDFNSDWILSKQDVGVNWDVQE